MANQQTYYNNLKRNPDNQFFIDLMALLNFRLDTTKIKLIKTNDTTEIFRLQGRAQELDEMISALSRKPVDETMQHTGAFN